MHANGLVHRDVKPSNIIYVWGQPKLADAGLVAAVDDARSLVGTTGYIAPEGPGTTGADIYALGKVLYEGKDRYRLVDRTELPSWRFISIDAGSKIRIQRRKEGAYVLIQRVGGVDGVGAFALGSAVSSPVLSVMYPQSIVIAGKSA